MREIVSWCWPYFDDRVSLVRYVLASVLRSVLLVAAPFLAGSVINQLIAPGATLSAAALPCALLALTVGLAALCSYRSTMLYTHLQADSSFAIDLEAMELIARMPLAFFTGFDPAYWRRRLDDDSNGVTMFVLLAVTNALRNGGVFIFSVAVMAAIDPVLVGVAAALAVCSGCAYQVLSRRIYRSGRLFNEAMSRYSATALRLLSAVSFIRRNALFGRIPSEMRSVYAPVRERMYQSNRMSALVSLIAELLSALALAGLLALSAWEVVRGAMLPGYVATVYGYFAMMRESVEYFAGLGGEYQGARVHFDRLRELFSQEPERNGGTLPAGVPEIVIDGASVAYPGADGRALDGVSHRFERGVLYGVRGGNGAGKSTLLKLINAELTDCAAGGVALGGCDIGEVDRYGVRRSLVGYVDQDPVIVAGTLWENLTLLEPAASEGRVVELCRALGLDRVLERGEGLAQELDEHRSPLSGGERQKVAIIRVLLKDPQVLLLDEPTSALDAKSGRRLAEVLAAMAPGRITIAVSHDPAFLDSCDRMIEL